MLRGQKKSVESKREASANQLNLGDVRILMVLKAVRLVEIPNLEERPKTELWDTLMFRCGGP